jgi:hypothetical protein
MKNNVLATFILFFVYFGMQGQNLVLNGGFEDTIRCPNDTGFLEPRYWYSPINGSPDYVYVDGYSHFNCNQPVNSPSIFTESDTLYAPFGHQTPHSGLAFVGFVIAQGLEYIAVPLSDSLIAGKKYCLEAYVSLAENSGAAMDLIGFCFTHDSLLRYSSNPTNFLDSAHGAIPNVENPAGNFIFDTTGWVLIADTFIAHGGERYLTIGNFDSLQTQYSWIDSAGNWTYYYFDDISVYMCGNPDGINETNAMPEISLTPNPSNGEFLLRGIFPEQAKIEIFDIVGQKVWDENLPQGNQTIPLNLVLTEGVYIYRIIDLNSILKTERIVIAK